MIVLQGFPPNRATTNPYLVMLADTLRAKPDIQIVNFTWRTAFTRRFDVYHTHWPENLGKGSTPLKSLGRQLLTLGFLCRLKMQRIPIVRTMHNLERPEGLSALHSRILDLIDAQTAMRIRLNQHTPCPAGSAVSLIPHGHYVDWFNKFSRPDAIPGRLTFAGLVRRYKGVEVLIGAFGDLQDASLSLCIAGNPTSASIAEEVRRLADGDQRIELDLKFQSEQEFAQRISESELVILPYHLMHNSGGTLAALSLNRPVLIPDNQINRELSAEVGSGWVYLFDGALDPADIANTLESLRSHPPAGVPDLSGRSWDYSGESHVRAYEQALRLLGAPRPGVSA